MLSMEQAQQIRTNTFDVSLAEAAPILYMITQVDSSIDDEKKKRTDALFLAWLEEQLNQIQQQAIDSLANILEDIAYQYAEKATTMMEIYTDSIDYNFLRLDKAKGYTSYWLPSDNKNYQDRIIANIDNIKSEIAGIMMGADVDPIVKMGLIHDELQKMQNEWLRLLDTEIEAAYAQGARDGYLVAGKLYAVIENGDACDECLDYVGEHPVELDGTIGVDLPPYHPNCRCVFVGVVEEEL